MLKAHVDAVEQSLLATSRIPANSGHSLHKGTPREAFIKTFLEGHLSERVAIGTGEIIDSNSRPGERRNQMDIVIYKRDYPKLDFGGGINGFLAESVVATIEVKSLLTKEELKTSTMAARNVKTLSRNIVQSFSAGYHPPSILSYVVAYDGPASMQTVYNWMPDIGSETGVVYPILPPETYTNVASPAIDAVFVLGKGFMHFGNVPFGFFNPGAALVSNPNFKWVFADTADGNLLLLFTFLTVAVSGTVGAWLNPLPYLQNFHIGQNSFAV